MRTAVVSFSGGQDSTTCLYWAKLNFDAVVAVSVRYGQRHAAELDAAAKIAELAKVQHVILDLPLGQIGGSALVDASLAIKGGGGYADAQAEQGLPTSFVPGRNLLLLTLAATVAVQNHSKDIVTGVCQTDYSGYPDCRQSFINALEGTLNEAMPSSVGPFHIHAPLMYCTKADTVRLSRRLPGCWEALALSMTCYNGKQPGCGECPACVLRVKGFKEAGELDPAAGM